MTDKNEIKDKELEEISGGLIPPYPPTAGSNDGMMPVIFASVMDKEEYIPSVTEPEDNAGAVETK